MQKRWIFKPTPDPEKIKHLSEAVNVNTDLATLLIQRGITTYEEAKAYFRPSVSLLHDPFLMKGMNLAVERVEKAIQNNEKILFYGDYDVDGTTSVALTFGFFQDRYQHIDYYIPDRETEGYGISAQGIDFADENGFSLIISLDCGIKAVDKVALAKTKGIDFIICDHHLPGETLPDAVAVLDPKQKDCGYPYKELSGCGVGFKLLQAYCLKKEIPFTELEPRLDLLAVSIAADIVPMTGENRALMHLGLKKINENPCPGLKMIIETAGITYPLNSSRVVFGIAPLINAAGRMAHAKGAVKLLLAKNDQEANDLAQKINTNNSDRKDLDRHITEEALEMIKNSPGAATAKTTVLYKEDWHKGVIGIVASRCIETYYRPTIILTKSNGKVTGSARSVIGFDVYEAVSSCSDLLEQYGGHKYAAGLTLKPENVVAFQQKFENAVAAVIPDELLVPQINIDLKINLTTITDKFFNIVEQTEPFGPQNMQPVFVTENVYCTAPPRVLKETHLKLTVTQENSSPFDVIGFGLGHLAEKIDEGVLFDICYTVGENTFQGITTLQLYLKDLRVN